MSQMTPREIVHELDRHIVGQAAAKRAVALALRTRWRRMQLPEAQRNEVSPKNILMIGPTGVGKTEIARRLARLANAPFIKVEATKFTEVGYVGRDVETIIRDLADMAIKMTREQEMLKVEHRAFEAAEERILDALLPPARVGDATSTDSHTRQIFRKKLREDRPATSICGRKHHGPARHGGHEQPVTEPLCQYGSGQTPNPTCKSKRSG